MGILQRFSDIMSANINSLLSGAEEKNAGKLLEKYLADARANLEELKSETSAIIADEMAAARRVAANNEEIAKYDRYAEQAVLAGNDDDARKFLDAKSQLVAKKAELEAAYETAKSNSDKMRQMTRKLMEDIASAEGKMVELRAKLTVAEHKEKMDDLMHKVAGRTDMSGFENMMEAVQKRIDSVDAKVALNEELADKMDIKKLEEKPGLFICNLGTGHGYSVLDVIHAFSKACGKELPYVIDPRRPGDIAECWCDPSKAKRELGWEAKYGIEEMCAHSWNWQSHNPDGYKTAK
mgnify:CR=1 FL=1